ncbi:hypothetical protein HYZ64_02480, partial [Candidatus Berkelbacteria bacterium]|nr:hypothetical protein [Candidatus Berkelbacteria bacterium]
MAKSLDIKKNSKSGTSADLIESEERPTDPTPTSDDEKSFYADEPESVRRPGSALSILNIILTVVLVGLLAAAAYLYLKGQEESLTATDTS